MRRSLKLFKRRFKKVSPKAYTFYFDIVRMGVNRNIQSYTREQVIDMLKSSSSDFPAIAAEHIKKFMEVSKLCSCSCSFRVRPRFPEINYYSNAEWTKIGSTSDLNHSEEQARSICEGLMKIRGSKACPIRGECVRAWVTIGKPANQ